MPQKDVPRTGRELSEWADTNSDMLGKSELRELRSIATSADNGSIYLSSSDLGRLLNPGDSRRESASIIKRLRREIGS
jgi:hypothetical protein